MLAALGLGSLEDLVQQAMPDAIRMTKAAELDGSGLVAGGAAGTGISGSFFQAVRRCDPTRARRSGVRSPPCHPVAPELPDGRGLGA